MVTYYYGINGGKGIDTAVVGTSTNSTGIEIVVDGTKVTDKQAVLNAVENLEAYITSQPFIPV
jgi:hypothetical protein